MATPESAATSLLPSLPENARLLVIRMRSLGDTLLLTPALRALKQWRPDLQLSVVLYKRFAPVLLGNPDVDEIIELEGQGPAATLELAHILDRLLRSDFSACFNLHGGTLSALLTLASRARHRLGFGHFRFPFAYTCLAPDARTVLGSERLHTVEQQLALFVWAGLPLSEIPPLQVFPQAPARKQIEEKLAALGITPGAAYAVLHPAANFFTKEWPFDRYAALASFLEQEYELTPVFTCGPGEGPKLDAVAKFSSRPLRRLDSLTIPELVALIEGARLFVGNDSGPAHIAAALERPTVALFGSSNSTAWRPWQTPHVVVQNDYPCNPCRGDRCYAFDRPECILSISLDQVQRAVAQLLARAAPKQRAVPSRVG